jgi:hypothetical protein
MPHDATDNATGFVAHVVVVGIPLAATAFVCTDEDQRG